VKQINILSYLNMPLRKYLFVLLENVSCPDFKDPFVLTDFLTEKRKQRLK
jgi:hypothetical protein